MFVAASEITPPLPNSSGRLGMVPLRDLTKRRAGACFYKHAAPDGAKCLDKIDVIFSTVRGDSSTGSELKALVEP